MTIQSTEYQTIGDKISDWIYENITHRGCKQYSSHSNDPPIYVNGKFIEYRHNYKYYENNDNSEVI